MQDLPINLDEITELEDSNVFKVEKKEMMLMEWGPEIVISIRFERNLDLQLVQRTRYTILDLLSDIGGIQSILLSAIGFFLSYSNFNYFDNYMASKLFKYSANDSDSPSDSKEDLFFSARACNVKDFRLCQVLANKLSFCRLNRKKSDSNI